MTKKKNSCRKNSRLIPHAIIEAATRGDVVAIQCVLQHYQRYIRKLATRTYIDNAGNRRHWVDDQMKLWIECDLVESIFHFDATQIH